MFCIFSRMASTNFRDSAGLLRKFSVANFCRTPLIWSASSVMTANHSRDIALVGVLKKRRCYFSADGHGVAPVAIISYSSRVKMPSSVRPRLCAAS
jgi:hypothetical protein